MSAAITPGEHKATFYDHVIAGNTFTSLISVCITFAAVMFAITIIRERLGMGYRLSLLPVSLMPLLIGVGNVSWDWIAYLTDGFGHFYSIEGVMSEFLSRLPFMAFCLFQTILLLAVTAFTFLNLKNGPLAALIATRPAAD